MFRFPGSGSLRNIYGPGTLDDSWHIGFNVSVPYLVTVGTGNYYT
jgi:hypothetical protein